MNKEELKAIGCTSFEELITEDFGAVGTEDRDAFEASCEAFIIGEKPKIDMQTYNSLPYSEYSKV